MNKKKLDKLFQDKFSDFKEMPDEKVWNSIEASLDKKKRKRMLPIWWQLGGIAALILIGLIVFNPFAATDTNDAIITDVEKSSTILDSTAVDASEEIVPEKISQDEMKVAVEDEKSSDINENNEGIVDTSEKTIEENEAKSNQLRKNSHLVEKGLRAEDKGLAVTEQGKDRTKETKSQSEIDVAKSHIDKTEVAVTDVESNNENPKKSSENSPNSGSDQKEAAATFMDKQNDIAATDPKKQKETIGGSEGKSIFEEIENQEEKTFVEKSANKWSAGPSIAPVYFNAIGDGSPVHSIFVPNSKSGDVNLSYGLSVAYEVSSKLKIRSGIHRVDYGYNTNDVEFSSSLASSTNGQINSINYAANSKNLVVTSKTGGSGNLDVSNSAIDASAQNLARDGVMSQQLGYLEVPLELNYALLDKKFGVNIIGGVSSLFLVDNSVALTSGELTTEMGEANNVNSTNFSTNIGLGVNYKFSSKIQLNVEPIFKYQLNTFSETAGNFRPYSIGVYSGLSFKF
jgi:hypothetical protein